MSTCITEACVVDFSWATWNGPGYYTGGDGGIASDPSGGSFQYTITGPGIPHTHSAPESGTLPYLLLGLPFLGLLPKWKG